MKAQHSSFDRRTAVREMKDEAYFNEQEILHHLKHYLPAQAPLKDFIHHNTLHSFQHLKFHKAVRQASAIFGYKASLSLDEYRALYRSGRVRKEVIDRVITEQKGASRVNEWTEKLVSRSYENDTLPRIGSLRATWKKQYRIDLDSLVHPLLFRVLCSFLDQGISIWRFPVTHKSFLEALQEMERESLSGFFKTERARNLLLKGNWQIDNLLKIIVGDESLYAQYLYDQQFAHPGWSGMVSSIEDQPQALLDRRNISLRELIIFELLLEIDALDHQHIKGWKPLADIPDVRPAALFADVPQTELHEVLALWQDAYEWSYYDEVLAGLVAQKKPDAAASARTFQAMFCIDDRECSFRRYLEKCDAHCETFSTAGFFGVEFFYQPQDGKFYTKLCPAPVTPGYLIKEVGTRKKREKDVHFSKHSHSFYGGWLISHTLGFWAALRLFLNIFKPAMSPATASSFRHMDKFARLTIENEDPGLRENNLQIGFTVDEMAQRVEALLRSIGLIKDFAPIIYVVGHGSSSVNNPHYAAYDCGACSGRAGSVNSRVFCHMANHAGVRAILAGNGIFIPTETQFLGGLHDTTRDEVIFFDEDALTPANHEHHEKNEKVFAGALDLNAKERSRRFELINTKQDPVKIHAQVKTRSVSLFEPRPELNHATNTLCIVGRRNLTKGLFLDRRSFLNSFDYRVDPEGKYLFGILKAAAPVCGGINLEYFFSRVDNQKLGAGTKLPHNVMGLFGVANGIDGDLRPGLPSQMIEVHDPIRLMIIVEHLPQVVLSTLQRQPETFEWFVNEWIHLVVIDPETGRLHLFRDGTFVPYQSTRTTVEALQDITPVLETHHDNLPVYLIPTETL